MAARWDRSPVSLKMFMFEEVPPLVADLFLRSASEFRFSPVAVPFRYPLKLHTTQTGRQERGQKNPYGF